MSERKREAAKPRRRRVAAKGENQVKRHVTKRRTARIGKDSQMSTNGTVWCGHCCAQKKVDTRGRCVTCRIQLSGYMEYKLGSDGAKTPIGGLRVVTGGIVQKGAQRGGLAASA